MLKLAYHSTDLRIKQNTEILQTRRVLLDGVLEKLQKWDELIELWTKELEKVFLGYYHFMFWIKLFCEDLSCIPVTPFVFVT